MQTTDYTPLILSLKVAGISTVIVFIAGAFFAHLFARKQFFGKSILESLFLLPLVLPPTVVGFGLLILFGKKGSVVGCWSGSIFKSCLLGLGQSLRPLSFLSL